MERRSITCVAIITCHLLLPHLASAQRNNAPPTVQLTAPASGATYASPATVTLTANAADPGGTVTQVDFYANGSGLGSSATAPYTFTWRNVGVGTYSVIAVAIDDAGASTQSSPITVTVNGGNGGSGNNPSPTVTMTSPSNGSVYAAPASIALSATAADVNGTIKRVDYYAGSVIVASANLAPFSLSWNGVPAGNYVLSAVATDDSGAATRSATVAVTVTATTSSSGPTLADYRFSRGWATFGLALPRGAATSSVRVGILATQTDVKTTWPDGSIRFAIVTAWIDTPGTYAVTSGASVGGSLTPVWPNVSVSFVTGGQTYVARLPSFRGADSWLSAGSLVRESRVVVTPTAGGTHPLLQVIFDIRSYDGGGDRVDVTVQNVKDIPAGGPVTYDVGVTIDGSTVYRSDGLSHAYMTRWRKVFTTRLDEAEVTPDFTPFYAAKALPKYLATVADPMQMAKGAQFEPLEYGDMSADMASPGGRPEIGPYPNWIAQYLVHKRPQQRAYMLASADLSGSWSGHITEADGTTLISLDSYPDYWLDGRAGTHPDGPEAVRVNYQGGLFPGGFSNPIETSHMPSLTFVPYLVTGDRYYLDQTKFWTNDTLLRTYPGTGERQGGKGILMENQPRGFGWALRSLADLAAYIPDADPNRAYFRSRLQNNLDFLDAYARTNNGGPFEFTFVGKWGASPSGGMYASLWQSSYVGWALDRAGQHGFGPVAAMRDRIARVQVRFFNSEAAGWPRINGAPYYPVVGTSAGFFRTMKEVFDASWANDPRTEPFAGFYGPEARLMLQIGVAAGMSGAQGALDYLMPFIASDINARSAFALAP